MSSEVDAQIERARAAMERISADYRRDTPARRRTTRAIGRRLTRIAIADAAIIFAVFVIGFIVPIGLFGGLFAMLLLLAATLTLAVWPSDRAPPPEKLRTVDIKTLPAQTERWLDTQRKALPAPAVTLVDQIGARLDALSPQLARVDEASEEAYEIRRLIGEQLPAFVKDYARVPETLRRAERNGRTPDGELVDGLKLIEREIADMTARLAQSDLDSLQTRGRFLEMKYKDGSEA